MGKGLFERATGAAALDRSLEYNPRFTSIWDSRRLALLLAVLFFCGYLRFINLGWGLAGKVRAGWHPDEQIVVAVDTNLAANDFDTDMKRAPLPEGLQWARYNFSSYFYVAYIWHLIAKPAALLFHSNPLSVLIYRQLSALLGTLACALVYVCARTFLNRFFAMLATLFTGVLPILVQDSHYARAEAFVTLGALGVLWLSLALANRITAARCLWAGLLVGFLTACKLSMAPFVLLPIASIGAFYWRDLPVSARAAGKSLALLTAGLTCGFVAGVPYFLVHARAFLEGWHHLRNQYSHPFPPYGTDPPGYCFGFIARYFVSTFGAPLLIAAALGIAGLIRTRKYFLLLLLGMPPVLYYIIFGFQLAFFERNVSHVTPWIAMLAAVGCLEILDWAKRLTRMTELRTATLALAIVLCLWIPLTLSWRIAVVVLSGHAYNLVERDEAAIRNAYPSLPLIGDELWADRILERIHQHLITNPDGYILKVGDANDELSRHQRFVAEHVYNMKLLAVASGHFSDLPVCTLPMYHGENYSWYLVRR